jgi:hypothetical protein
MAIMLSAFGLLHFVFNVVTNNGTAKDFEGNRVQPPSVIEKGGF